MGQAAPRTEARQARKVLLTDEDYAMKGLWAGALGLALSWSAAGAWADGGAGMLEPPVAKPPAASPVQGVTLGRPQPAVAAPAGSGVVPASYQAAPPVPITTDLPPVDPPPKVLPEMLPRKTLPKELPYLTAFATDHRAFGQPIIVASTSAPAKTAPLPATAPTKPLTSLRQAFAPPDEEMVPATGLSKYFGGLRQVFAPVSEMLAPVGDYFAPETGAGDGFAPADGVADWPYRYYGGAEYLLWWTKGMSLPPMITTGPTNSLGIIGQPGTVVLFGGNRVDPDERQGGRFTLGFWCDPCQLTGVEANWFFLGRRSARFPVGSDSTPLISRPFFSLNEGRESTEVATFPGEVTGTVVTELPSRLWGGQVNLRRNWCRTCTYNLDLLVGFRYLELEEGLQVVEDLRTLPTAINVPPNTRAVVIDRFDTRNQFYGGQVGAAAEFYRGPWFLNLRGTVALGNTHQIVNINGSQSVTNAAGQTSQFRGGLLALPSNSGNFSRDRFTVVPELGVNLGYQFSPHVRVFAGYNFLYWSNVLRPGDQIDRVLDTTQIPNFQTNGAPGGLARPIVPFKGTDFWAQGINVGFELRY